MSAIDYDEESRKRLNWLDITGGGAKDSLTVLDYFAGKAMMALLEKHDETSWEIADEAYDIAEVMLKVRSERFTPQNVVKGVTGKTYG